jgi:hypothetical protein
MSGANVYLAHFLSLVEKYRIAAFQTEKSIFKVRAKVYSRQIFTLPVKTYKSYISALHEIGHVLDVKHEANSTLEEEIRAWAIAKKLSIIWDAKCVKYCMESIMTYCQCPSWLNRLDKRTDAHLRNLKTINIRHKI